MPESTSTHNGSSYLSFVQKKSEAKITFKYKRPLSAVEKNSHFDLLQSAREKQKLLLFTWKLEVSIIWRTMEIIIQSLLMTDVPNLLTMCRKVMRSPL